MTIIRTTQTVEVFTVVVPGKTGKTDKTGKIDKDPDQRYHFTSHKSQVTMDGIQYIPLSLFDQARWAELCKEPNGNA